MSELTVPPKTASCWRDIATGKIVKPWEALALKIMMMRISNTVKADPSAANVDKCAGEIYEFFVKNQKIAQKDIASILS
jgi:hypothetical protein